MENGTSSKVFWDHAPRKNVFCYELTHMFFKFRFLSSRIIPQLTKSAESPTLYVNPLCLETDRLLLSSPSVNDLLGVTVTHRGVIFVHNLITAAQCITDLVHELYHEPARMPKEIKIREICKDERFSLFVNDLEICSSKIDLKGVLVICQMLKSLDYRLNSLIGSIVRRTYSIMDSSNNVSDLLEIGKLFEWAGYGGALTFYNKLGRMLCRNDLTINQLMRAVDLFGSLDTRHKEFFSTAGPLLMTQLPLLSGRNVGRVSIAFGSDRIIIENCAKQLVERSSEFKPIDAIRVVHSMRRVGGISDSVKAVRVAWKLVHQPIYDAYIFREPLRDIQIDQLCDFCEDSVVISGKNGWDSSGLPLVLSMLEDRIGEISEKGAIQLIWSAAISCGLDSHGEVVKLLARKIGASEIWENRRSQVFWLWIHTRLFSPWVAFPQLKKNFLRQCLRAWALERGGLETPCRAEADEIAKFVKSGVRNFWLQDSPFYLDFAIPEKKIGLMIVPEFVCEDNFHIQGSSQIAAEFARSRGWQVVIISKQNVQNWLTDGKLETEFLGHRKELLFTY